MSWKPMETLRRVYKVPATRGMRVIVDGEHGRITRSNGFYLRVQFDSGRKGWCHPTWRVEYEVFL